jgi:DNA gyrase/topoisomerase IV subunit B
MASHQKKSRVIVKKTTPVEEVDITPVDKVTKKKKVKITEKQNTPKKDNKHTLQLEEIKPLILRGTYSTPEEVKPKRALFINKVDDEDRKYRDVRSGSDYKNCTEHVKFYKRPQITMGSMDPEERSEEIFNIEIGKFEVATITVPYAMIHTFMEIISNAADNADFTRRADPNQLPEKLVKSLKKVGKLEITFDRHRVKIRNGGIPIIVEPGENVGGELIPLVMFGRLNSSTGYDDDEFIRTSAGLNGHGSKACFLRGTLLPLFNGDFEVVENIKIGDFLIGDDGTPREVLELTRGRATMYEISSPRGITYTVNGNHTLSLKMEDHKVIFWSATQGSWSILYLDKENQTIILKTIMAFTPKIECPVCGLFLAGNLARHHKRIHSSLPYVAPPRKSPTIIAPDTKEVKEAKKKMEEFCKTLSDDNVLDIRVKDYIKLTDTMKSRLSGFRGECVQWSKQKVLLDPYVLGAWLGDGTHHGYSFTTDAGNDPEILNYLKAWGKENDANFNRVKSTKYSYSISSMVSYRKGGCAPLRKLLKHYNLLKEKHIPHEYLINSRKVRLAVLAGMIDTDGGVTNDGTRITICQGMMHERLANDIVYLARSLGFMCNAHVQDTQWTWNDELRRGEAFNINISGDDIGDIPTLLPRKKCCSPVRKNVTNNGVITVKKVEKGKFYGFETDGNHRYVLSDFTVTHNCNILSTYFRVRVGDSIRGQEFDAIWVGNMTEVAYLSCIPGYELTSDNKYKMKKGKYVAKEGKKYTGPSYVEVEYELDFDRFGYKKYPEEIAGIFMQRTLFMGMSTKSLVSINGEDYDVRNIREFAKLRFSDEACKTAIIHYEWPAVKEGRKKVVQVPDRFVDLKSAALEKAICDPQSPDEIPTVELLALDTPNEGAVLSSVNGQCTPEDGVHVTESFRAVAGSIISEINDAINKIKKGKDTKGKGKGKNKEVKEVKMPQLTVEAVKKHVSMVVSCRLQDTSYNGQTKTKLTKPKPKITIDPKTLAQVSKWQLVVKLEDEMRTKLDNALKKSDGKKRGFIKTDKGEDANQAGKKEALKCVLYWAEGDSATSYPKQRISLSPGGKDYGGYFPGKGKFINACKATPAQFIHNDDIKRFKNFTGAFEDMDVTKPADMKKMRYGFIMITTDADKDGQHILMLRLNYIYRYFRSLITEGMVGYIETPFARALKGKGKSEKCLEVFANETTLKKWLRKNADWFTPGKGGHIIKYYKGLASSRNHDIAQDLENAPMVVVVCDDEALASLDIAFQPKNADLRKDWIAKWRKSTGIRDIALMPMSEYTNLALDNFSSNNSLFSRDITTLCNYNLIDYSTETYIRALPSQYDGVKESQRKSLYGGLVEWSFGNGRAPPAATSCISSSTAKLTKYHYGGDCLTATYTRQAQEFTGGNNMSYFTPEGQLGSRHQGGADAGACRYTQIDIAPWIRYVYKEDFLKVIPKKMSEGTAVEPEWLPSVIPMHMVNGFRGIATGYSTFGANHNPFDCIDWCETKCKGGEPKPLIPWYNGFTGEVKVANIDWSEEKKGNLDGDEEDSELESSSEEEKEENSEDDDEASSSSEDEEEEEKKETKNSKKEKLDEKWKKNLQKEEKEEKQRRKLNKVVKGKPSMKTYGVFRQEENTIYITDLPIGTWVYSYRKYWEDIRENGGITDIRDMSPTDGVNLTITGYSGIATYKSLKLVKGEGLANMVLIDNRGYPTRFKNTQEIMECYYKNMITMFTDLRALYIKEILVAIHDVEQRLLFIISHNEGNLVIKKREDDDVYTQMDTLGIEHKYYDLISARDFSDKKIEALQKQLDKFMKEHETLLKSTAESMWLGYLDELRTALKKLKICKPNKIKKQDPEEELIKHSTIVEKKEKKEKGEKKVVKRIIKKKTPIIGSKKKSRIVVK